MQSCPSTEGGHNWQAMSYHPATGVADHPAQPVVHGDVAAARSSSRNGSGGTAADRRFFEMPGSDGNVGKLAAYDVKTMKEVWSHEQRAAVPHRRCSRPPAASAFVGDLDRTFRALDVKTGEVLWQTRLGTSVQGFPVSFSAGGQQYIAVTTGLGGGSPRNVPRTISPDVRHPLNGNAIYVFALPERAR